MTTDSSAEDSNSHIFVIKHPPDIDHQHSYRHALSLLDSFEPDSILILQSEQAVLVPSVPASILSLLSHFLEKLHVQLLKCYERITNDCLAIKFHKKLQLFSLDTSETAQSLLKILKIKFQNERKQFNFDTDSLAHFLTSSSVSNDKEACSGSVLLSYERKCNSPNQSFCKSCNVSKADGCQENNENFVVKRCQVLSLVTSGLVTIFKTEKCSKSIKKYGLKNGPSYVGESQENEIFSSTESHESTCVTFSNGGTHKSGILSNSIYILAEAPSVAKWDISDIKHSITTLIEKYDLNFATKWSIVKNQMKKTIKVTCKKPLPYKMSSLSCTYPDSICEQSDQVKQNNTTENKKARKLHRKLLKYVKKLTSLPFSNRPTGNPVINIRKLKEKTKKLNRNLVERIRNVTNLPLSSRPWGNPVILGYPMRKKKNERPTERRPQRRQPHGSSLHAQPSEDDPNPVTVFHLSRERYALPSQPEQRNVQHLMPSFTPRVEPVSSSAQEIQRLSQRPRHRQYAEENSRHDSFIGWPSDTGQNPENMVTNGFFYTGQLDLIRCFMCGIGLKDWSPDDEPLFEHVRHSPECPFLYTYLGRDVLDAYKAALLPGRAQPASARGEGLGTQGASNIREGAAVSPGESGTASVRNPGYEDLGRRIESFHEWPGNVTQTPRQLAEAGFFHTGDGDTVRCFHCDGGLRRWDPRDDPWIEHTRWFPHCPYVRQIKGVEYVELVQRAIRESAAEDEDEAAGGLGDTVGGMANLTVQTTESSEPSEPAVSMQTILDMGYTRQSLTEAMQKAEERGMVNYTPEDLLEILLEMGTEGQIPPPEPRPQGAEASAGASSEVSEDDPLFVTIENKSLRKVLKCSECKIRDKNVLFLPCTHHCLCEQCAEKVTKCPICDKDIIRKIKTYMS